MGCSSLIRSTGFEKRPGQLFAYPRHCAVKKRDDSKSPYDFILTNPTQLKLESILLNNLEVVATQCVLPGIDPKGEYFKKCQDSCIVLSKENSLLLALFDGHGAEGTQVVQFCILYVDKYYLTNWNYPYVINK
jgi:hypothetical protein